MQKLAPYFCIQGSLLYFLDQESNKQTNKTNHTHTLKRKPCSASVYKKLIVQEKWYLYFK